MTIQVTLLHRVSEKTVQIYFCQNFVKFPPILIIFGKKMTKRLKLCEVYSFFISINLRHHTIVLNADAPNCYTMLKVVSIRLLTHCIINSIEGITWLSNFVGLNIWLIFFGILLFTAPKYLTSMNSKHVLSMSGRSLTSWSLMPLSSSGLVV